MEPERYGQYRVFEQLGSGGMATVHRAEIDTPDGVKQVALKRLTPTIDKKPVNLFQDEARLLQYLKHPNISEFYETGRVFGTYFIAMEYIQGTTLKQLIEHCATSVGPVPQGIALNLIGQLCDALDYAHKRRDEQGRPLGIIHRDVTPANLILEHTGVLKLVDFGLAKAAVSKEPSTAGVIKGKLGYVAPEYTRGQIDQRADLWAVGIILYELLTGRRLFDGAQAIDTLSRVRELPIPRPSRANPRVAPEIDDLVMTALERDPQHRWPSGSAMRNRINALCARLGEQVDNQRVVEWVTWALGQQRGRQIQMTPVVALPALSKPPDSPVEPVSAEPSAGVAAMRITGWNPRAVAMLCGGIALLVLVAIASRFLH